MRRGELLKLPELKVTETMRKTVREDQGNQVLRCGKVPVWSATLLLVLSSKEDRNCSGDCHIYKRYDSG